MGGIEDHAAGAVVKKHGAPLRAGVDDAQGAIVKPLEVPRIEQRRGADRVERGERAAEFRVDRGGECARDLDAGALGLLALLVYQRKQADSGHYCKGQERRRREVEQPRAQGDAPRLHLRACFSRKALISSRRSCGSPGMGWLPTTRFIHCMLSCMRATTARHSFAVCRFGSGSTWHWLHAIRNASPSARNTSG